MLPPLGRSSSSSGGAAAGGAGGREEDGALPLPAVGGAHLDVVVRFEAPDGAGAGGDGETAAAAAAAGNTGAAAAAAAAAAACPHPAAPGALPGPAVGLLLKSWRPGGAGAAAVAFCWATRRLEVHFDEVMMANGGWVIMIW